MWVSTLEKLVNILYDEFLSNTACTSLSNTENVLLPVIVWFSDIFNVSASRTKVSYPLIVPDIVCELKCPVT